jgi:hypothetical protein
MGVGMEPISAAEKRGWPSFLFFFMMSTETMQKEK